MPKIKSIVTGGAGFIGSNLVDRLVSDDGLRTYTQQDEVRARAILMETDLANGDHNLLRGDPSLTSVFDTYSPANALIR